MVVCGKCGISVQNARSPDARWVALDGKLPFDKSKKICSGCVLKIRQILFKEVNYSTYPFIKFP